MLTILLMVAIVVGAISSYMSLTRNREAFKPQKWAGIRERYFKHMDKAAADLPPPPPEAPQEPGDPYFSMSSVRRLPKIEDEDEEFHRRDQTIRGAQKSRWPVMAPGTAAATALGPRA